MNEGQLAIIWFLISTLALCALLFGMRYLANKENMSMIERGINPRDQVKMPAPYKILKWAMLLIGSGCGLLAAFFLDTLAFQNRLHDHDAIAAVYFSLIAIGGGLGLLSSYKMEKKWLDEYTNNNKS